MQKFFIGILILVSNSTATIIILSVFGALLVYLFSVISMIKLRETEPNLPRPFKVKFYPVIPIIALGLTLLSIIAMTIYNLTIALLFVGVILIAWIIFKISKSL